MPQPRALKRLEQDQTSIDKKVAMLALQADACEVEMKGLKVVLYAKFGKAINLDEWKKKGFENGKLMLVQMIISTNTFTVLRTKTILKSKLTPRVSISSHQIQQTIWGLFLTIRNKLQQVLKDLCSLSIPRSR